MTSDDGYRAARLCGLTISFRTQRQWRKVTPVAAISYGGTSLAVELNPAWTSRGQYWRIEKEITTAIGNLRTSDLSAGRVMSVLVVS